MSAFHALGRSARKVVVLIVGVAVVIAGVVLLAAPGPGVLVIIGGLVILATEFAWAQRWLDYVVERAAGATTKVQGSRSGRIMLALSGLALIAAGVVVIVFFSQWIVAGISLIVAGLIGLCTLVPKVQDWIAEKSITGIDDTDDVH
ncbi:MAG: PGPGW domain-containing protein [Ilumatobacter sp.]|uniref:PGPGW domain-containing protein n=1 Tax=Ilumatobacter sp. TaxID=1967498 RepID=UPI003298D36D